MEEAECAYLSGQFEKADSGFDTILREARSPVDRAAAYRMRVVQYENLARYDEFHKMFKVNRAARRIH